MDGNNRKWWERFLPEPGYGATPGQVATSSSATGLGGYKPNTQPMISGTAGGMISGGAGVVSGVTGPRTAVKPNTGPTAPSLTQLAGYTSFDPRATVTPSQLQTEIDATESAEAGRDWTGLFANYRQAGMDAAAATRAAQQKAAEQTYQAQLSRAQEQGRQNRLSAQMGRQQIAEQDFMQQRALMQGAQARGLGGSGLEQLGQVQARTQTGRNINQLAQQEIAANTDLRNYLGEIDAQRETGLTNAEAVYQTQLFKLAGDDLDQVKYLDSIEYRDKVLKMQEKTNEEQSKRWGVDKEEQLLLYLANPDVDDYTKVALAKLAKQAGTIDDAREAELLSGYLGAEAADFINRDTFDWTTPLQLTSLGAAGGTIAAGVPGGIIGGAAGFLAGIGAEVAGNWLGDPLKANYTFTNTNTGATWKGSGAEAVDKNNSESMVYAYRNRAGYNDIEPFIRGGRIFFRVNSKEFQTYRQAENEWRLMQG